MNIVNIVSDHIILYNHTKELKKLGHKLVGMCDKTTHTHTLYDGFELFCSDFSLQRKLSIYASAGTVDVVKVQHEPAVFGLAAKQMGFKVVAGIGDLNFLRTGTTKDEDELALLQRADGLIYNQESFPQAVADLGIKTTENWEVVGCMVSADDYHIPTFSTGGIVYEGNVHLPNKDTTFNYRRMDTLADVCSQNGIPLNIYPTTNNPDVVKFFHSVYGKVFLGLSLKDEFQSYKYDTPVGVHSKMLFDKLIPELGQYHWGFVGSQIPESYQDHMVPCKLFDYMAAGIPVLVSNMKKAAEFVEREGIGIVLDNIEDIPKVYDRWKDYKDNVLKVRDKWALGNHIHKVTKVLENAIGENKND